MKRRYFAIPLFLFLAFFSHPVQAALANEPNELLGKIRGVEERVKKIEANQQEILAHQQKILSELDNLRIWIARR